MRYGDFGHNGGLCAGLLGPSFIVNTIQGAISIAIHRALKPGPHHLVGVYDGVQIKLYIDGTLAAQRPTNGYPLQTTTAPIDLGHIAQGTARFEGTITEVYLANTARDDAWVEEAYRTTNT